ncbi:MAG: DUF6580 family putative transport protein [Pirellula sp.]
MPTRFIKDSNRSDRSSQGHSVLVAVLLLGLTLALRFAPLPENFSAFGALAIFCGLYTSGSFRWWFPLAALFLADCIGHFARIPGMGFYHLPSMLLNYTGLVAMTLASAAMRNWTLRNRRSATSALGATTLVAIISSACFFLISNFGAWLDPLMQYERSPTGLLQCYIAGIPFWRASLTSDVVFTLAYSLFAIGLRSAPTRRTLAEQRVDS